MSDPDFNLLIALVLLLNETSGRRGTSFESQYVSHEPHAKPVTRRHRGSDIGSRRA